MRISELSRRVGVHVETLRAWERRYGVLRPRRSAGNTRLYSAMDEARVRVMQRYIAEGYPAAQAAEMAMTATLRLTPGKASELPEHERARALDELATALAAFDESSADRTLQQLLGAYATTAVLKRVVLPYLHELGERWVDGQVSIVQEHFATHFVQVRLHALARGWDRGLGPRAVVAAADGDHHTLGLTCFGIALHQLGWRIVCLGASTPIELLGTAASATDASLIAISASIPGALEPHADTVRGLATQARVVIGGPSASPELARRCGATYLADAMGGAEAVTVESEPSAAVDLLANS